MSRPSKKGKTLRLIGNIRIQETEQIDVCLCLTFSRGGRGSNPVGGSAVCGVRGCRSRGGWSSSTTFSPSSDQGTNYG